MIRRRLATVALGLSLLTTAHAEPTPAPSELSAADAAKVVTFFEKLLPAMTANKDDCAKMATAIDTLVTQNAASLKGVMKKLAAGKALPKASEEKLRAMMAKDGESLMKCAGSSAVVNAMKRVENPDLPPAPSADVLAQVQAPVKADLETYTKGLAGKGDLIATITTPLGTMKCQLFGDRAPATVANFIGLATGKKAWLDPKTNKLQKNKPYYNGTIFHRVIPDFMIQGGDPTGTGMGGPGYDFADEVSADDKMAPGTLAMANSGPSTNGSQFFIVEGTPSHLNGKHTIFGTCKPLDVVGKIARVKKADNDKPVTPVKMKVAISRGTF